MTYLSKHARLFRRYCIIAFKKSVEYKASFYSNLIDRLLNISLWLLWWQIIIGEVTQFREWTFPMTVLLIGFYFLEEALWIFFWRNWNFSEEIINGNLTIYLVKPINTYLAVIWRHIDFMRLGDLAIALGLLFGSMIYFDISTTVLRVILGIMVAVIGTYMSAMVFAFTNALAFWIGKVDAIRDTLASLFIINRMPLNVFPAFVRIFYIAALPIMFIATYPVLIVTEFTQQQIILVIGLCLVMMVIWTLLFQVAWHKGLQRFEAYGG